MNFFSISPVPSCHYILLVWQHYDVLQTSATASKRLRIWPKGCILLQHFEANCVRNVLIVKYLEQQIFKDQYHVKEKKKVISVPYILKAMLRLLWPHVRRIQWRWRCIHVTLKAITLFVVQPTGSAPVSSGSAEIGYVPTRIMCVTAMPTVATVLTKETAVSWCLWQWCWWWW